MALRSAVIVSLCLLLSSGPARAIDWKDTEFKNLVGDVKDLLDEMKSGKQNISAQNVRDSIADVGAMLVQHIPDGTKAQQFRDGECPQFKADIQFLFDSMFDLSNTLLGLGNNGLGLSLENPGTGELIEGAPCAFLYPLYELNNRVPIVRSDLVVESRDTINVIDGFLFPDEAALVSAASAGTGSNASSTDTGVLGTNGVMDLGDDSGFEPSGSCSIIADPDAAELVEGAKVLSYFYGTAFAAMGTVMEVAGHTAINGPDQVEGAVWGWAGVTIENDPVKAIGIFYKEAGKLLLKLGSTVNTMQHKCELMNRMLELHRDHATLQDGQEEIVRELSRGQKEIIRLLLTPQGRRTTELCVDGACSFPVR